MRRTLLLLAGFATLAVAWPGGALAHGVQGRAETPIPVSAFFWVAAAVLVVSFVGLGVGWSRPRPSSELVIAWRQPQASQRGPDD